MIACNLFKEKEGKEEKHVAALQVFILPLKAPCKLTSNLKIISGKSAKGKFVFKCVIMYYYVNTMSWCIEINSW